MIATFVMVRKLITFLLSLHYCIVVFSPQSAKPAPFGEPKFRIYWAYIRGKESNRAKARVFKSGNSRGVRLLKKFRVRRKELKFFRRGDELVLKEKHKPMERVFELLASLPDDFDLGDRK